MYITATHRNPSHFSTMLSQLHYVVCYLQFYCLRTFVWVLAAKVSAILLTNPLSVSRYIISGSVSSYNSRM
jgi:hypothetical protein